MTQKSPTDYCKLWLRQNDALERDTDQAAFDELPPSLRRLVDESPIRIACLWLLRGVREFGADIMEIELRSLLTEWQASFSERAA